MAKRKREETTAAEASKPSKALKSSDDAAHPVTVQIVTGSYERVLHGITATIPHSALEGSADQSDEVQFLDTFLFNAHASAVRCLALSPLPEDSSQSQTVLLASGGTDERINLYTLSATPTPSSSDFPSVPTLAGNKILENPKNRELGSLLHHSSTISSLNFPTRTKLLASAEDNTISVTRIRDLSVVSTIKAPRPKATGRPSGDTAPVGGAPAGVNDFAVHPSMKLMLSVGRGEKCMRLWNLVTGKKAGVLNFGREVLQSVKEGKWNSGEGRKIIWNAAGEEFAVMYDRGVVVFGIDSVPKCYALPTPLTKVHHIQYVQLSGEDSSPQTELLAVSTENGRILFYSTDTAAATPEENNNESSIPAAVLHFKLGGKENGQPSRIKNFEFLTPKLDAGHVFVIVTSGSDGSIKLWLLSENELKPKKESKKKNNEKQVPENGPKDVGKLLGTYETGNRITCLKAFVMNNFAADEDEFEEFSGLSDNGAEEDEDSDSGSDDSES